MYYSSNTALNALAKAGRESLFAVADAYNISASDVFHVDNCNNKVLNLGSLWSYCKLVTVLPLLYFILCFILL